jgi:hypothetical protein
MWVLANVFYREAEEIARSVVLSCEILPMLVHAG